MLLLILLLRFSGRRTVFLLRAHYYRLFGRIILGSSMAVQCVLLLLFQLSCSLMFGLWWVDLELLLYSLKSEGRSLPPDLRLSLGLMLLLPVEDLSELMFGSSSGGRLSGCRSWLGCDFALFWQGERLKPTALGWWIRKYIVLVIISLLVIYAFLLSFSCKSALIIIRFIPKSISDRLPIVLRLLLI